MEQDKKEEKKNMLINQAKKMIIWEASAVEDQFRMVVEDTYRNQFYNFAYEKELELNQWNCVKVRGSKKIEESKDQGPYVTIELKQPLEDGIELGNCLLEGHAEIRLPVGIYGGIKEISRKYL